MHYRFRAATVEVILEEDAVARWLREFVSPWFVTGVRAEDGPSVRMVGSSERFSQLVASQPSARAAELACFNLDSSLVCCPGWSEADGTMVASDAKFGCLYRLGDGRIEVVAPSGDGRARIGLLRVVREILTARAAAIDSLLDLHAAAFVWRGRAVLLPGDKNAGKTTLLAHALTSGKTALLANDRVMVTGGAQAYGVPTVVSVREGTLRRFPVIDRGPPAQEIVLNTEERAALKLGGARPAQPTRLSPGQFARELGATTAPAAPVSAVVFPELCSELQGWRLHALERADEARRLRESLYGRRTGRRPVTWFQSLAGAAPTLEAQVALADQLAEQVPCLRCLLGPDAYQQNAQTWLDALPLSDGAAPS